MKLTFDYSGSSRICILQCLLPIAYDLAWKAILWWSALFLLVNPTGYDKKIMLKSMAVKCLQRHGINQNRGIFLSNNKKVRSCAISYILPQSWWLPERVAVIVLPCVLVLFSLNHTLFNSYMSPRLKLVTLKAGIQKQWCGGCWLAFYRPI